jgi:GNAT superfamily N-acetyltransferase
MTVQLKEVTTSRALKSFIRFPKKLYRGNPYWVPALFFDEYNTLHWEKNPAFENCEATYWLAYRGSDIVGRVAAIWNKPYVEKWGNPYVRFGWLDFIDDEEVSAALMGAVEGFAREKNMQAVHGPLGFTDLDHEGMLVEGFNELGTLATIYNHPYYVAHLERMGYIKDVDWVEYEIVVPDQPIEKIERVAEAVMKRSNLHLIRAKKKKELMNYAMDIFHVIDEEYAGLYGTVPLSEKQMRGYIDQYFGFVVPEMVPIVLDENNRIVAFAVVMNSLSRALRKGKGELFPFGFLHLLIALGKNDLADMYLVAIRSEYQGMGVNAVLMSQIHKTFRARGIRRAESNPELETNVNVQGQWKFFEHRQHKRRRCFIKMLDE